MAFLNMDGSNFDSSVDIYALEFTKKIEGIGDEFNNDGLLQSRKTKNIRKPPGSFQTKSEPVEDNITTPLSNRL